MRNPNFFMIGAPKCGTSAMAAYLTENPQVFFCRLKEPFFWAADFPEVQRYYGITTLEKYLDLFRNAGPQHRAVGEGSTAYFFSAVAVQNILAFNESSRILVMLRDPVQMVQSWHNELIYGFAENVADFETAWNLQTRRAQGENVPATCPVSKYLQYREVGSYATYLEPLTRCVPAAQLKIVLLEDFSAEPRRVYCEICSFLGVDDDGRREFEPVRESQSHVWPALSRFIMHPPEWFRPAAVLLRRNAHQQPSGIFSRAKRLLRHKKRREPISADFERHLRETFEPEIGRLEVLLRRPLDRWRMNGTIP